MHEIPKGGRGRQARSAPFSSVTLGGRPVETEPFARRREAISGDLLRQAILLGSQMALSARQSIFSMGGSRVGGTETSTLNPIALRGARACVCPPPPRPQQRRRNASLRASIACAV
jgi:hypothetical protein